jgi:hypothetical protein
VAHLGDHRPEHLGRRRAPGDERRHPPERGLLVREAVQILVRLAVRDRGGHEPGELRKTILDPVGERRVRRRRRHHAPDEAVDDDRGAGGPRESRVASSGRDNARKIRRVLDPRRATRPQHLLGHRPAVEGPARTRLELVRTIAPLGDDRHRRAVAVVSTDRDHRQVHHLSDLAGNGRERLRRRRALRDERRHPTERRLLLGEPPVLDAMAHLRVRRRAHQRDGTP